MGCGTPRRNIVGRLGRNSPDTVFSSLKARPRGQGPPRSTISGRAPPALPPASFGHRSRPQSGRFSMTSMRTKAALDKPRLVAAWSTRLRVSSSKRMITGSLRLRRACSASGSPGSLNKYHRIGQSDIAQISYRSLYNSHTIALRPLLETVEDGMHQSGHLGASSGVVALQLADGSAFGGSVRECLTPADRHV